MSNFERHGQWRREHDRGRATISSLAGLDWAPWLKHSWTLSNLAEWITSSLQKKANARGYVYFVSHNQVIPSTQSSIASRQKIAILLILLIHLLLSACCFWQCSYWHRLSFRIHDLCFLVEKAEHLEIKLDKLA